MPSKFLLLVFLPALAAASHIPHQPRQTSPAQVSACLAALESVGSSFPTVPPELVGLTDIAPITNPCDYTPPAAMATVFSSFETVLQSWVSENWPKVISALGQCPSISSEVEGFARAWDQIICTDKNGQGTATTTRTGNVLPTATGGAGGSVVGGSLTQMQTQATSTAGSAGVKSSTNSAGGASETGFVAGVVAVVGLVGAVVAL